MYFVFDIGNVLFSWNPDIFLAQCFPDDVMRLKQMIFLGEEWKRLDLGELSLQEVEILQKTVRKAYSFRCGMDSTK